MSNETNDAVARDDAWLALAGKDPGERLSGMVARFRELVATPELERAARLQAMAQAEDALSDGELRDFTLARLRARLTLASEEAALLQPGIDAASASLKASAGMRRTVALQAACKQLSLDEVAQLETFFPGVRQLAGLPAPTSRPAPLSPASSLSAKEPPAEPRRRSILRFFNRA